MVQTRVQAPSSSTEVHQSRWKQLRLASARCIRTHVFPGVCLVMASVPAAALVGLANSLVASNNPWQASPCHQLVDLCDIFKSPLRVLNVPPRLDK